MDCVKYFSDKNLNFVESELKSYFDFIYNNKADHTYSSYTEKHHILPRSLFPEYIKEKWNIVKLSGRNHFLAHYFLAKACDHPKILFAFNQMKRVLQKDSEDYEELSSLYEEFRIQISKIISETNTGRPRTEEQRKSMSERTKGKATFKYVDTGVHKLLPLDHPDILSGKAVFHMTGKKHSEETKKKQSISLSAENRGEIYHMPGTEISKYYKEGEQPNGWIKGWHPTRKKSERSKGKWYHNAITGEYKRILPGESTEGMLPGRWTLKEAEDTNPWKNKKILRHIHTHEVKAISRNEPNERYYANCACNKLYYWVIDNISYCTAMGTRCPKQYKHQYYLIDQYDFDVDILKNHVWVG